MTIIAEARNAMRGSLDPTAHAEMVAIRAAAAALGTSRLDDCTLWVSLEPCAMCAAAIALARSRRCASRAEDPKGGGVVHGARMFAQPTCHHRPDVLGGIGEDEAAAPAARPSSPSGASPVKGTSRISTRRLAARFISLSSGR